jgi:hypothetical protein
MLSALYAVSLVVSVTYKPFILSIMTLSIMDLIAALSIMTLSIMDLIAALSIMTLGISIECH